MTFRRQVLVALVLALPSCSEPTVSDRGLQVDLTIDRTLLRPGETAQVTVAATNWGLKPVIINTNPCAGAFVVFDKAGTRAGPALRTCSLALVTRELAPGETHVFRHSWAVDGFGDITKPRPLAAGTYTLRGHVFGQYLAAESSPLSIRVEAAPGN